MKKLKYNFEYFCSPFWIKEAECLDCIYENLPIEDLPVSSSLIEKITSLDKLYQSTYNDDYPPEALQLPLQDEIDLCIGIMESSIQLSSELSKDFSIEFDKEKWLNRKLELEERRNA